MIECDLCPDTCLHVLAGKAGSHRTHSKSARIALRARPVRQPRDGQKFFARPRHPCRGPFCLDGRLRFVQAPTQAWRCKVPCKAWPAHPEIVIRTRPRTVSFRLSDGENRSAILTRTGQNCCRNATVFEQPFRDLLKRPKSRQMLDFSASRFGKAPSHWFQN